MAILPAWAGSVQPGGPYSWAPSRRWRSYATVFGACVTRLPRRAQPGTLANPAGLTDRELETLRPVATGLSNAEIARRLVLSPRTVDHHVSAILGKLGVPTRRDAAVWAARLWDKPSPRGVI